MKFDCPHCISESLSGGRGSTLFGSSFGIIGDTMRFALSFLTLSLLLTACSRPDAKLSRQIAGTWTRQMGDWNWTNPAVFTRIISPDGSFSTSFGHSNALVTYQGTWLIRDGELVMTVTNAHGTENHEARFPVGSVDRCKIIHVDDHQFVYEAGGHTNILSR